MNNYEKWYVENMGNIGSLSMIFLHIIIIFKPSSQGLLLELPLLIAMIPYCFDSIITIFGFDNMGMSEYVHPMVAVLTVIVFLMFVLFLLT